MLVLDSAAFSDEEIAKIRMNRALGAVDVYSSVRGTVNVTVGYDVIGDVFDGARAALLSLVERAAAQVRKRTGYFGSHSPGVVEYIAAETGRRIRQPSY
jgi:hypothetical protein